MGITMGITMVFLDKIRWGLTISHYGHLMIFNGVRHEKTAPWSGAALLISRLEQPDFTGWAPPRCDVNVGLQPHPN